jgi:DNA-binding NarL/FixJ family response regulator
MMAAPARIAVSILDPLLERVVQMMLASDLRQVGSDSGDALLITDALEDLPPTRAIAIVHPSPASCAAALRLFMTGEIVGATCRDEIDELIPVVNAAAHGLSALPTRVISIARSGPTLTSRQVDVLRALIEGLANRQIARHLELSEATVRRELQALATALHADSRCSIVAAGHRYGYGAPPLTMG